MKLNLHYSFIFLVSIGFVFSCKKKENAEPKITITSPATGKVFMPGDTIRVEADISDDNELTSVTLKLLNAAYTPVDHQESFSINASSYHLSYQYVIENNYIESGNYFVTLSTSDGTNDHNEFRTIVIHEIPRARKAVYVLTQSDTNHVEVNTLDSAGQLVYKFDVFGDYSGSVTNSRYNQLHTAGKIVGAYNQYDLSIYSVSFSVPAYNVTQPSFQNLFFAHNLTFVSYYDGRIRSFDQSGNTKFNSAQPVFYQPGALCVNDKYVFAEGYYQSANENRLIVIFYSSGVARQEYNIGMDIVSIVSNDDNNITLFGNKNGDGKIFLYDALTNGANDFHTLFGNIIYSAIAIDNDRYALATANGLYSYQQSINNLIPVDVSEPVYSLEYDNVNAILFANAGRKIKEYAFPDAAVLNTVLSVDSVLDVRVLYSK